MRNILIPVNREESVLGLLPEQRESLTNKCQPCGDISEQKDGHDEIKGKANDLEESLVEFEVFQNVIDWRHN